MRIVFLEKGMNTNDYINFREGIVVRPLKLKNITHDVIVSRVAQWKRAGPITQRSEDQNFALLGKFYFFLYILTKMIVTVTSTTKKFRIKNNIQIIDNNLINEWN